MKPLYIAAALLSVDLAACSSAVKPEPTADRWWEHIEYLASDELEGRATGSEGHRKAVRYVAEQFEALGLEPGGTQGYLQPVEFETRRVVEENSALELLRNGKTIPLELGRHALLGRSGQSGKTVEAEMVFVGYGQTVPEHDYDDFRGLDVKGKVVVALRGAPAGIPSPLASHYQSGDEARKNFKRVAAIGSVGLPNPRLSEIPWERITKLARFSGMDLTDPELARNSTSQLSVRFNAEHADLLLEGSGRTFEELLALDREKKPLPKFPLVGKIRGKVALERSKLSSDNVIGIRPGDDPELKNEYVLLSAHLDHEGVGEPINGDSIYNGAMDNASGIATLLEAARLLGESGQPLRRSVIFLACTGEEKGLLGSRYYASRPTVDINNVVANINLDMFLPLFPLDMVRGYGLSESDLGDRLRAAAESIGIGVQEDPTPERNIFIRSDQYNFIKKGIPALFLGFGFEANSPQAEQFQQWLRTRYHAPSDDLAQPVDRKAAAVFNRLMAQLAVEIANADERPRWREDSFFRRFASAR